LILGSAIYVAMHREDSKKITERERGNGDEERGLMMADMDEQSVHDNVDIYVPLARL
jgi:hypothetical protein